MLVIACPRCRIARVVEDGRKTASCGSCSRTLMLADLRPQWSGSNAEEARRVVGEVNARLQGGAMDIVPPVPKPRRHDDAYAGAAAEARLVNGEAARVDRIARALSKTLGEFHEGDLQKAMHMAGVPSVKTHDHVERMLITNVLFEPRPGRYRAF